MNSFEIFSQNSPLLSSMKLNIDELPLNSPKYTVLITLLTISLLTIPLYYHPFQSFSSFSLTTSSAAAAASTSLLDSRDSKENSLSKKCDVFKGEWVRNPDGPYYTYTSCWEIHEHQNCMKYGRPDTDFMKWRWQPNDCELPIFNHVQFLELLRGKSLAFVGDSVGRNQMDSLICLLSKVEHPVDISDTTDIRFRRWHYANYNFTMANFWAPFLVRNIRSELNTSTPNIIPLLHLYLDELDDSWTTQINDFNYVILNGGQWFFGPAKFYENGTLVGCPYCREENVTQLTPYYGYRKALRTSLKAINSLKKFKGVTFLRTYSPSHFENGDWNTGGTCARTKPFTSNETRLEGRAFEVYMTQLEEFKVAEAEGKKRGLKFGLLDTTEAMLLRPDGHPSHYGGHLQGFNNDCVHWCLPGPIDTWNEFLLDQMLKMEIDRLM